MAYCVGYIDRVEMQRGLDTLGMDFSNRAMDDIFTVFDKDGTGSIDYGELLKWIYGLAKLLLTSYKT